MILIHHILEILEIYKYLIQDFLPYFHHLIQYMFLQLFRPFAPVVLEDVDHIMELYWLTESIFHGDGDHLQDYLHQYYVM